MKLVAAVWENVYGLLVDDGWIASGTLIALVIVGLWAVVTGANGGLRDLAGPLLFAMLMALMLVNLYATGRTAARKRVRVEGSASVATGSAEG